jgi:hypothetical protein
LLNLKQTVFQLFFRTRTSSIINKNYTEMSKGHVNRSIVFWLPLKYGELVRDQTLSSGYNMLTLFQNRQKKFSVALSKHVTHYGSWSGFPYYNLTTPIETTLSLSFTKGRATQLWVWTVMTALSIGNASLLVWYDRQLVAIAVYLK